MARSKLFVLARSLTLAASVGAPCLAHAADLIPPPPPPPMPPPVEVGGGWYLRGDIGASIYERPTYYVPDDKTLNFFGTSQGTGLFAGVGVGYQFNSFLRGDVTGEYRSTGLRLNSYSDFGYSDCNDWGCKDVKGRSYNSNAGNFASAVVLANVYADLGTFYGVTPFVGGGVGVAFNYLNGFSDTGITKTVVTDEWGHQKTYSGASGGVYKDSSKSSLAWALHAGLAYDVTPNFKVELAYRYLNLGQAKTGVLNCFCGDTLTPMKVKDLESHDIKIGLRYLLGGGFVAAPLPPIAPDFQPAPGPLVRKY